MEYYIWISIDPKTPKNQMFKGGKFYFRFLLSAPGFELEQPRKLDLDTTALSIGKYHSTKKCNFMCSNECFKR